MPAKVIRGSKRMDDVPWHASCSPLSPCLRCCSRPSAPSNCPAAVPVGWGSGANPAKAQARSPTTNGHASGGGIFECMEVRARELPYAFELPYDLDW